ncbi:hypothetical protein N181_22145 [Sinorhizobium fredii USDA 205]|uniref:Uncharacterized protein n=1 Tax=Rhizobium fredii TaxID=380 RepID=A0A844A3C6_RHIFR|nr:hypothetical protein [Sinorhizobium fredii]ASY71632.1 hypothetical protein SF83666_b49830 [Sinorhizobium fredii CCBAU 83666]KSV86196.1 hypothetical protein N181_22145 [Sinorhizobium fredii USDA 205]MQX07453.1 hypothetical protein [Sinorhizobium fredii]GEC34317.1 hypothetical protein EFR01_44880 [Sinorhizobium fredii]GLS06792.1 hypothetical protein GCM10007864_04170 [Sinorhizobium fredii]
MHGGQHHHDADDHHHHDHDHDHEHEHEHGHDHHQHRHRHAGPGHNRQRGTAQWQVPHRPESEDISPPRERDLDLVEASFVENFARASDPTSFLRLADIPFVGLDASGKLLHLLRVEAADRTDVGAVVPLLGGNGVRYDVLPARMTSRRQDLSFLYHDGQAVVRLHFTEARKLKDRTDASHFDIEPTE